MSKTLFDNEAPAEPAIGAIAPWFGSNRMLAPTVAQEVGKVDWCGVPFAGGMSEVLAIRSREFLVNDLHRDIINLAKVLRVQELAEQLQAECDPTLFHQDDLEEARAICLASECPKGPPVYERAKAYFVCVWLGRSAKAGTDDEFRGNLAIRYTASGGGSNKRFRSAVLSVAAFHHVCRRCEFTIEDFREFFKKCKDREKHAVYIDAPFPEEGDSYRHKFTQRDHRDLAACLSQFKEIRVVIRFYDHPLIRELYPEGPHWTWRRLKGRDQANNGEKAEALIINGDSYA